VDSGFYAACTALIARTQSLDVVANNLANVSTSGYRAQNGVFRAVLASQPGSILSPLNQATNNFAVADGQRLDLSQGSLQRTGNDLDFAINGKGFFVVQTTAGRLFTRDGNFHVSPKGQLVTADGDAVMGEQGTIQIPGAGPVSVSRDGTVSIGGALAGKLKLVEFAPDAQLQAVGKTYYSAPRAAELPANDSQIQQGMLESSNVNPVAGAVQLITVQRYAEMMQRALSMFHNDMNRIAAEELPRISS
jgi:flagellar basal-body rod protein FlgF/flagellar basal-body rod protein FlgG